jgi:hypothetical protein
LSGGGRLLDEETGRMVYKEDQIFSSIANAFVRAMELMSPVAVIAGECNQTRFAVSGMKVQSFLLAGILRTSKFYIHEL